MNDNRLNQAIQELKKVHMTQEEKRTMLARIGVQPILPASKAIQSPWSIYSFSVWIKEHESLTVALAFIVIIFTGGGMVSAAQRSLPGDVLYPLKIGVTEPLREVLTFSPVGKALLASDLAGERLTEAATLASQGRLDASKQIQIETLFDRHTAAFNAALNSFPNPAPVAAPAVTPVTIQTALQSTSSESERSFRAPSRQDRTASFRRNFQDDLKRHVQVLQTIAASQASSTDQAEIMQVINAANRNAGEIDQGSSKHVDFRPVDNTAAAGNALGSHKHKR